MRFRQFLSDVEEPEREKWDCQVCVQKQLYVSRNCPIGYTFQDTLTKEETPQYNPASARNKYAFNIPQKNDAASSSQSIQEAPKPKFVIRHGDFEFTECPVPFINEEISTKEDRFANFLLDMVNWSEDTGQLPVDGGLLEQSNVFFMSRKIILSEKNKIEAEKHKEQNRKNNQNKTNQRKPRVGK